jgi:hypothetical protein
MESLIKGYGREKRLGTAGLGSGFTDGCKVVSPTHRPHSTPQKYYFSASGTHFCWRLSKPQGLVRPKGLGKLKKINFPHRISNPRPSGL